MLLTFPLIGLVTRPPRMSFISQVLLVLARHRDKLTVHSQRDTLAAQGDKDMNHEEARSRVKEIAENASGKQDVDDKTWNDLIEIGNWTKAHAPYPALLEKAIPQRDSQRTWMKVRHSAETILKALA
jgi:hypothetical protein